MVPGRMFDAPSMNFVTSNELEVTKERLSSSIQDIVTRHNLDLLQEKFMQYFPNEIRDT